MTLLIVELGGDKLVSLAVDIDNLDLRIVLQVLAQLSDINVHRAGVEVVIVDPDGLQGKVALQDLVRVAAQQSQQLVLLGGELGLLLAYLQQLLLGVEGELSQMVDVDSRLFLPLVRRRMASIRNTSSSIEKGLVI